MMRMMTVLAPVICGVTSSLSAASLKVTVTVLFAASESESGSPA